jgi:hypothetical protein
LFTWWQCRRYTRQRGSNKCHCEHSIRNEIYYISSKVIRTASSNEGENIWRSFHQASPTHHAKILFAVALLNSLYLRMQRPCIHTLVCLTAGPLSLPKRVLHSGRSRASSVNLQYPLFSLKLSSSCLGLLLLLLIIIIPVAYRFLYFSFNNLF